MTSRVVLAIIGMLILLGIVGVAAYQAGKNTSTSVAVTSPQPSSNPSPTLQPTATRSISTSPTPSGATGALDVANSFYNSYLTCAKQNGSNCDYKTYSEVDSQQLSQNMSSTQGANPILCSQNIPDTVSAQHTNPVQNGKTTAYIVETFRSGSQQQIMVDLQQESGQWKIVNVTCPRP